MILTCPNCATQYVVKDGAIPPQGRQVRCAACKHSWHQDPESAAEPEPAGNDASVAAAGEPDETFAEAAMIEPSTGPEAEERAFEEAVVAEAGSEASAEAEPEMTAEAEPETTADADAEPGADRGQFDILPHPGERAPDFAAPPVPEAQPDDDFSPFAERDYVETRRRRPLRAILVVLLLVAVLAVAFWFFAPPQWKARLGLAGTAATPLQLSNPPHMELRPLASGNQLLTVAGRIINPTGDTQPVPPIYAQLRDRGGKVVYSWTIPPPAPTIGPGESKAFNSAEVNVPTGAENLMLEISIGSPRA